MTEQPPQRQHPLDDQPRHPLMDPGSPQKEGAGNAAGENPQRAGISLAVTERPTLTYILIGLNLAIYALGLASEQMQLWLLVGGWADPEAILRDFQVHRLLTAMFLHSPTNLMHILFNMYALFIIGTNVERIFGSARFGLIYFLGGLTGSVFSVTFGIYDIPSVGASGAVFAVWAAEALHVYRHRQLFGNMARRILLNTLFFLGFNLFLGFTLPNIDNWGHIGGFVGGAFLTWLIGPVYRVGRVTLPNGVSRIAVADTNALSKRTNHLIAYGVALGVLLIFAMAFVGP